MILILQQPGTSIGKKSELITIKRNARTREVAVRQIESVVVLSQVQISHDAILLLVTTPGFRFYIWIEINH